MKRINILYWIVTGLFGAFMFSSSIGHIMSTPDSVAFISGKLGYPEYIVPFLGVLKALGVIAILLPAFPRIQEWAYAGLCFDLIGATYSIIAVEGINPGLIFMAVVFAFFAMSYILHHKRREYRQKPQQQMATAAI